MNILFICSRNKWRSLTAENLYKNHPYHHVKSAGTAKTARIKINSKLITWANLILVMEKDHQTRLKSLFPEEIKDKQLFVLGIKDEFQYMDPQLITIITEKVSPYL